MFFGLRLIGRVIGFAFKVTIFVAAIAAVAGAVAYALFDGEQYKQRLSKQVFDLTGRVMTVNGKAQLELSLPPRIVLNDVRLKNARWGSRPDMARIKRVEIQLNPLKAISGGDSMAQVRLDGADVLLETNSQGVGNWELGGFAAGGALGTLGMLNSLGLLGATPSTLPPSSPLTPSSPPSASPPPSIPPSSPSSPSPPPSRPGSPAPSSPPASASRSSPPALLPSPPPPSPTTTITVSNPSITFRDGSTGREQSVSLGAAVEFTGGAEGSHVLAAAASDDTNPCDGTQRQPPQSQQAAKPR